MIVYLEMKNDRNYGIVCSISINRYISSLSVVSIIYRREVVAAKRARTEEI